MRPLNEIILSQQRRVMGRAPIKERLEKLRLLRSSIIDHQDDLNKAFMVDMGKSETEVYMVEILPVLKEIDHFLSKLKSWSRDRRVYGGIMVPFSKSRVKYEPFGSVLIISPWNYPFHLCLLPLVGVYGSGNSAVIKPSFNVANVAMVIEAILRDVFSEDEVYVVNDKLEGYGVLDFKWDFVFFTGGSAFGRRVGEVSGRNLTPFCLELGGKSPVYVDKGADLNMAAKRIAWGKTLNSGQTCVAPDYVLVYKDYQCQFCELVSRWMYKFNSYSKERVRIINVEAFDRLSSLIDSERDHIFSGGGIDRDSLYIEPTVFEGFSPTSRLMQDEIFGPLLPVISVDDVNSAISFVNSRDKPLAAYYFGNRSGEREFVRKTNSGGFVVNDVIMHIGSKGLPFGGVGNSGLGSYHGRYSFELFSQKRSFLVQPKWFDMWLRYKPYVEIKTLRKFIR